MNSSSWLEVAGFQNHRNSIAVTEQPKTLLKHTFYIIHILSIKIHLFEKQSNRPRKRDVQGEVFYPLVHFSDDLNS